MNRLEPVAKQELPQFADRSGHDYPSRRELRRAGEQATLKVVGAFHGLSRERSDARKYPAIHPLESWSKYRGVTDPAKTEYARKVLFDGNEVAQMMKVVGEEGTTLETSSPIRGGVPGQRPPLAGGLRSCDGVRPRGTIKPTCHASSALALG